MKKGAEAIGEGGRFKLELAVSFDPEWTYDLDDAHNVARARNSSTPRASSRAPACTWATATSAATSTPRTHWTAITSPGGEHGAQVRELHLVSGIEPVAGGYRSTTTRWGRQAESGSQTARIVIVAAGSLGSTELLLRCREVARSLPNISPFLGRTGAATGTS